LLGANDKAIRQLELTYGGGKTHTLITLYHLVRDPDGLPDLPAVAEFLSHIGRRPPKTRVAGLPFGKLDAEKGMGVCGPQGERRWLKTPWSVLAFPLKQASLDSVHEKNVRHGPISTLHIWPARRPLAACRAALIATLLPDPGTEEARQQLLERIGGKVIR